MAGVPLLLDTNVLLVVAEYLRSADVSNWRRRTADLNKVRGRDPLHRANFELLWSVFQNAPQRIVTQYVIAELFTHGKLVESKAVFELLSRYTVEEHSCTIEEMQRHEGYQQMIRRVGPTDTSLIFTAEIKKGRIISDDGQLRHWAHPRGVSCFSIHEVDQI